MSKKIAFLLDTGSSFNLFNHENCFICPINICVEQNNKEIVYQEDIDISRNEIYDLINKDIKIKTSQPTLGKIMELMNNIVKKYDLIIAIPFSKYLSNTFNTFVSCAKQINKNKIIVLDSHPMSITGNWLVNEIIKLNNSNVEINQKILDKLAKKCHENQCGVVIVNDLKQLIAGGRLTGIKGLLAKALKLKLSIMYKGDLKLCAKDLTIEGSINKSLDEINKKINFNKKGINKLVIFPDLNSSEENDKYINYLKNKLKIKNPDIALLPTSVVVHTGTNTFSFLIESK